MYTKNIAHFHTNMSYNTLANVREFVITCKSMAVDTFMGYDEDRGFVRGVVSWTQTFPCDKDYTKEIKEIILKEGAHHFTSQFCDDHQIVMVTFVALPASK